MSRRSARTRPTRRVVLDVVCEWWGTCEDAHRLGWTAIAPCCGDATCAAARKPGDARTIVSPVVSPAQAVTADVFDELLRQARADLPGTSTS